MKAITMVIFISYQSLFDSGMSTELHTKYRNLKKTQYQSQNLDVINTLKKRNYQVNCAEQNNNFVGFIFVLFENIKSSL